MAQVQDVPIHNVATHITFELTLDGLRQCFGPQPPNPPWHRQSQLFGPGFRVSVERAETEDQGPALSVFLSLEEGLAPIAVNCKIDWRATDGSQFTGRSNVFDLLPGGPRCGWPVAWTARSTIYRHFATKKPDSVTCLFTLQYQSGHSFGNLPETSWTLLEAALLNDGKDVTKIINKVTLYAYEQRNQQKELCSLRKIKGFSDPFAKAANCSWAHLLERGLKASLWTKMRSPSLRMKTEWEDGDSDVPETEEVYNESGTQGGEVSKLKTESKVLVVVGAGAVTMEAVIYWTLTGRITFKPLSSRGRITVREFLVDFRNKYPGRPHPPSCKSVYRVAHSLGIDELKTRALQHLETQLTVDNVLQELFSEFAAKFEDVRSLAQRFVSKNWKATQSSPGFSQKMTEVVSGRLPHAGPAFTELWAKVKAYEAAPEPSLDRPRPRVRRDRFEDDW